MDDETLKAIPPNAISVKVVDQKGRKLFRTPEELVPTDTIVTKGDGTPIVMTAPPGRRKQEENAKVVIGPSNSFVEALNELRNKDVNKDPVLTALKQKGALDKDAITRIVEGMAEEAANLKFDRDESQRMGEDSVQISMKRVNTLKALADVLFKQQEQEASEIDFESPSFIAFFHYLGDTFKESMLSAGIRDESIETTINILSKALDDSWKDEAKRRMRMAR